jgi:hypothetical protein
VDDKFSPSFITTIGIDFKVKQVAIGDKKVKLQVLLGFTTFLAELPHSLFSGCTSVTSFTCFL